MSYRLLVASILALGCASSDRTCRSGSECPSGICTTAGTCLEAHDAALPDAFSGDASSVSDAFAGDDAATIDDAGVRVCSANRDGVVDRSEVPLRAGLHATFRIAQNTTVSTAGDASSGTLTWDLGGMFANDADAIVDLIDPSGTWWSASYPTATYAAQLAASSPNLGVFAISDTALTLLGVVSPMDGVMRTNLAYDPPVTVLAFPIHLTDTWTTTSMVTGQADGVAALYTETYTSVVDASGTLITPLGSMDVLRVRTDMHRTSGVVPITSLRTFGFVAECFGTAATITSQPNPMATEFTNASEVRRLAP
jgi:hypothetical protein